MGEPTTTTTRCRSRCRKHAFARFRSPWPRNGNCWHLVTPGHGHNRCPRRDQLASGSPVAGGDPVNETDPSGDGVCIGLWTTRFGCWGTGPYGQPGKYTQENAGEVQPYGYCQVDCVGVEGYVYVLTGVVNEWDDLQNNLRGTEEAYDEMLDMVAGSYASCADESAGDCISNLTSGDLSTLDTPDNSINWWNNRVVITGYQDAFTVAAWLDGFDGPAKVAPVSFTEPNGCASQAPVHVV
jgi:hypothetical protein